MDFTAAYCPERKHLEHCNWNLISALSVLTERLFMLVGKDHAEFLVTKTRCTDVRREILESHDRLLAHRCAHGC
jgi:hypothetical protein